MSIETGKLELGTTDGEWPAWATLIYELPTDEVTYVYNGTDYVTLDRARFTERGRVYTHAMTPVALRPMSGDTITISGWHRG